MKNGTKFDQGKKDWSLVDLKFIEPLIDVFVCGEKNHGYENWKKEFDNCERRFFAAMMRHVEKSQKNPLAWNEKDQCYHLAQVAWNALFRLYHALEEEKKHAIYDDAMDALISSYNAFCSDKDKVSCYYETKDHV